MNKAKAAIDNAKDKTYEVGTSEALLYGSPDIDAKEVIEPVKQEVEETIKEDQFYRLIKDREKKILPILDHDSALFEKMARSFVFTLYKEDSIIENKNKVTRSTPQLRLIHARPQSIVEGFIKCCENRLEPVTDSGKIYMRNDNSSLEVTIGYQGYLDILWRFL